MPTRETPAQRGRRRGQELQRVLLGEIRKARVAADLSQRSVAARLGWSQTEYWRMEAGLSANIGLPDLGAAAAMVGLDISAGLHPMGDPINDRGQQAVISRLRRLLSADWRVVAEAPLPNAGDRRSWDLLIRIAAQVVGVEVETRIRDIQAITRRIRGRERDGGVDEILVVLAETRTNRLLVGGLREALGAGYGTAPGSVIAALRNGQPVPGSAVLLI